MNRRRSGGSLYQDPVLDALVQEAFRANTDLAVAAANSVGRPFDAGADPHRTLSADPARRRTERARDATTDEILEFGGHPPQTFWFYDALLDVSYEVDLFGHVRRAIEAARADTDAALAARDVVQITVAAETTRAYAQVCALGEAIARHASLDRCGRARRTDHPRIGRDAGAAADFDVVRAQGLTAQVRASLPAADRTARVGVVSARAAARAAARWCPAGRPGTARSRRPSRR